MIKKIYRILIFKKNKIYKILLKMLLMNQIQQYLKIIFKKQIAKNKINKAYNKLTP